MSDQFEENQKRSPDVSEIERDVLELKESAPEPESPELVTDENEDAEESLVGKTFAERYEVLAFLGKGGMSTVYKVRHTELDVVMALKVLHKHLWTDPLSVERFRMEAKTIGRLSSSYLVTFRDFGVTSYGQPYLVMDYLDGLSLGQKIKDDGHIELNECLNVFEKLCRGLEEAHKHGITHRDIKPDNVVFLTDGSESNVKLVDFGIAKISAEESDQRMTLTQTGEVFGSPLYMSPEQCLGVAIDHRSDIYSMGCLFYEALVGMPPLAETTILETMNAHLLKKPSNLSEQDKSITGKSRALGVNFGDLEYVVMKCLQKKADDRYQSASQLRMDIEKIRNNQSISGKQKLWKQSSPVKKVLWGSTLVVLSLLTICVALYFTNPKFKVIAQDLGLQSSWQYYQSMGRAASTLRDYEAAEEHFNTSLKTASKINDPGERHVKRLASLENLSNSLQYQAKYRQKDEVLKEYKRELRTSLGEVSVVDESPFSQLIDTMNLEDEDSALKGANILYKLGTENAREGKTEIANKYLNQCYDIRKKWLKESDEKLIESMDALANVSVLCGDHRKAGRLWEEAYRLGEKYLPADSKVKVSLYKNRGRIFQSPVRRDYRKAEEFYNKAVVLSKKVNGLNSAKTLSVMKDYAAFLIAVGRKDEAEKMLQEIENIRTH